MNPSSFPSSNLPPDAADMLRYYAQPIDKTILPNLIADLHAYRQKITQASVVNEFLDRTLADRLYKILLDWLNAYDTYSEKQQAWIIGATRYFIHSDDSEHDFDTLFGFDDDAQVVDTVAQWLANTMENI